MWLARELPLAGYCSQRISALISHRGESNQGTPETLLTRDGIFSMMQRSPGIRRQAEAMAAAPGGGGGGV